MPAASVSLNVPNNSATCSIDVTVGTAVHPFVIDKLFLKRQHDKAGEAVIDHVVASVVAFGARHDGVVDPAAVRPLVVSALGLTP